MFAFLSSSKLSVNLIELHIIVRTTGLILSCYMIAIKSCLVTAELAVLFQAECPCCGGGSMPGGVDCVRIYLSISARYQSSLTSVLCLHNKDVIKEANQEPDDEASR